MIKRRETAHDDRALQGTRWVEQVLGVSACVVPLAGDASFRRYFRVRADTDCCVLMDSPPEKGDVQPFLAVRDWMAAAGLRVPQLIAADPEQGFLLLEDFGDVTWAVQLQAGGNVAPLMADALRQLALLQQALPYPPLAPFDATRMRSECELYLDWYLPWVAGFSPTDSEREAFIVSISPLLEEIAALPRAPVHLDYHSRNLMLPDGRIPLGVIDFQDAVAGPLTYDTASLLYDCYQDYPEELRRAVSEEMFTSLPESRRAVFSGVDGWHRALRLTAFQRHIKAIGIFARLAHRDGKRQFLDEIPLTRKHLCAEMEVLGLLQGNGAMIARRLLQARPAA